MSEIEMAVDARATPTDVNMPVSGAIAGALTVLFYYAIGGPFVDSYAANLFIDHGWVPYAIFFLGSWAFTILVFKAVLLRMQARALQMELLPKKLGDRISPQNAMKFGRYIQSIARSSSRDFLVDRILRAVMFYEARENAQDVVEHLDIGAQADANAVESSYTMIRVFVWAIPILGFIGTVLGISAAVASFSVNTQTAVDLVAMKSSISLVTQGLGVAFDTTLLGLVVSILIMLPAAYIQKTEEDFLASVSEYCNQHLVSRLDDRYPGGAGDRGVTDTVDLLRDILGSLKSIEQRLRSQVDGPDGDTQSIPSAES